MKQVVINDLKTHCLQDKIPIVRDATISLINELIDTKKINHILEIGTGYGYSALCMASNRIVDSITTIEKDLHKFLIAKQYLSPNSKITLIHGDAFKTEFKQRYDLIFIDGPKSNQIHLVQKYCEYLTPAGIMIIDNIYLKKITGLKNPNKNQKALITKIKSFES
jgi:predicted O-methyltransferase YrrM